MYNIYKHQQKIEQQQLLREKDQNYAKWLIKHQQLKKKSIQNMKIRVKQFVDKVQFQKMQRSIQPTVVEDDHYKTWRYNKQYRDVEDKQKFVGFKNFRHNPNYDIGRYFTQRQRKQISFLPQRPKMLISSRVIPEQHLNRSLRSQGPFNPIHSFRNKKPDNMVLQPRMRYASITDKQRAFEASMTYDDKFHKIYNSYSLNKSQIGQTKISPIKKNLRNNKQIDMLSSKFSDSFCQEENKMKPQYYDNNQQQKQQDLEKSYNLQPQQILSTRKLAQNSQHQKKSRQKAYFKAAKTMALYGDRDAHRLMLQTQYDRKKDLTNLSKNIHNQSFIKRPIL